MMRSRALAPSLALARALSPSQDEMERPIARLLPPNDANPSQDDIERLRGEVEREKQQTAGVQAQLVRLLKSAPPYEGAGGFAGGGRTEDSEWRAVMVEQLETGADQARRSEHAIAELGAALGAERERVVQLHAEMRMAVIKGEALQVPRGPAHGRT
jgi:hypothetical protein